MQLDKLRIITFKDDQKIKFFSINLFSIRPVIIYLHNNNNKLQSPLSSKYNILIALLLYQMLGIVLRHVLLDSFDKCLK